MDFIAAAEFQRLCVGAVKRVRLAMPSVHIPRPHRVNDELAGAVKARRDDRAALGAMANCIAGGRKLVVARPSKNRSANAAARPQVAVGRIDNPSRGFSILYTFLGEISRF